MEDLFYIKQLEELKKENINFDFEIYLSREETQNYNKWYVTDYINLELKNNFEEIYICWIPNMINSATEKLIEIWIEKGSIFTEMY